jgi:sugar/nucleoside kinase (ribokinase family)
MPLRRNSARRSDGRSVDTRPAAADRADVVAVGLNATDTLIRVPRFPAFDSKTKILSSSLLPGGQAATAAVACRRWGLRSRYVGKIGDDAAGRLQREEFAREGVEARLIEVPNCASQLAFIIVDQSTGERTILWQRDDRLDLRPEELPQEWIRGARLVHVDGHPCAPAAVAARWAREAGAVVTADLDNLYPGIEELLEHVDFMIGSRDFPERLLGTSDLFESLPEINRRFGCRVAGATLGCDGVLAWDGTQFHYCPAFRVAAVDTTGAGDVFHAGLAYSLLRGDILPAILEFSCAAAGLNCTAPGARGGISPVDEIEKLRREGARHERLYRDEELQHASVRAASSRAVGPRHSSSKK